MSYKFTIQSKSQSNRPNKPSASFFAPAAASSSVNYVSEFNAGDAPAPLESKIKPIAPIPNDWRPNKKLKNLQTLPSLSQSTGADSSLKFELDPGSIKEPSDSSMTYGLNLRQPATAVDDDGNRAISRGGTIADLELRKLRDDLENLPDDTGMAEFEDVPVEGFGLALLMGYGWKEGKGIGRNAKEDVKITEVTRKSGKGGLGFTGDLPGDHLAVNGSAGENIGNSIVAREKTDNVKEKKRFGLKKEVRVVKGREMGVKGKIVEVGTDGDLLILRISKTDEKVKVRSKDVVEVGSTDEEKFLRKLKELKIKEENVPKKDKRDRNSSSKRSREKERTGDERVNWLRNHIRVKVISEKLKGGRLFLKKGVVVDVVGPGVCDIVLDESRELVQGVDQDLLETALPKPGGPVLILYGKHKGVYGSLLERDTKKETGIVRDADTHELLNVTLGQISEFTGDPSDIGY